MSERRRKFVQHEAVEDSATDRRQLRLWFQVL